jgi:hypothetical protein
MNKRARAFTFFDSEKSNRYRDIHMLSGCTCHAIVFRYQYDGENYLSFLNDEKGCFIQEVRLDYEWRQWTTRLNEGRMGYKNIQTILAIWEVYRIRIRMMNNDR